MPNHQLEHPVPARNVQAIGDVVVSFALLENALQMLAGSLIAEHQRVGQIITSELSFSGVRALTKSLYIERHGNDEHSDRLKDVLTIAAQLEGRRNQIVHSIWGGGGVTDTITRMKATSKEKRGFQFSSEDLNAEDIFKIARSIRACAQVVQELYIELLNLGKAINNPIKPHWGPHS